MVYDPTPRAHGRTQTRPLHEVYVHTREHGAHEYLPTYLSTTVEPDIHYTRADIIERALSSSLFFSSFLFSYLILSSRFFFPRPLRERRRGHSQSEREEAKRDDGGVVGLPLASTRASNYHRGLACISCLILAFPSVSLRLSAF